MRSAGLGLSGLGLVGLGSAEFCWARLGSAEFDLT